jgi:hypothetical protein
VGTILPAERRSEEREMGLRQAVRRWWDGAPGDPEEERAEAGLELVGVTPVMTPKKPRRRSSPWTRDPENCEICGRHLLIGEVPAFYQRDDGVVLACPVCAGHLAARGLRVPGQDTRVSEGERDAA